MYKINDAVMYGALGPCTISSIETLDFMGDKQEYYVLKPINSEKDIFYVPTNNQKAVCKLRSVCSKSDVDTLISQINSGELIWIENDTERKAEYGRIIKRADKYEIIMLLRTLYLRRQELVQNGKKLRASDENYFRIAEKMIFDEFAFALGIDKSEVVEYIKKHIS